MDKLIEWKNRIDRKPLILKGVRQCGKTYLLKEFGEKHYPDTAYFNFEGNSSLNECFERDLDVDRIITELGVLRKKSIKPHDTLIIFDEIQFSNKALTSLKYFNENSPDYHIVCAGSMLRIALSQPLSFPVGKVDMLNLRPMSFYEFLIAHNEEMLIDYLNDLTPTDRISDILEDKLETYLHTYYITGGMPAAVNKWLATKDITAVDEIQQGILDSYELDFAKHAPAKDYPKLSLIWHSIPAQLAKENKKYIYSKVKQGLRVKDLEDALQWLLSAGLVYKIMKIEKPFMPLSAYADQSYFKLYMSDIGLLRKMAKLPAEALLKKSDTFTEFKGALIENYALCEIISVLDDIPFYWKSENIAEVDMVAQFGMDIVPIEVKSEHNDKSKSLSEYRRRYNPRISIITSMNNISGEQMKNIPLYLLWKTKDYI